ncbi:MAG: DUF192 domain-containing protein [Methanomassiliicoccales archaeon]|jgi:uncharacterized membrane protein (UPF0127 family)
MGSKRKLYVEVADTHFKRECGLQKRKQMGQNEGMLFKFPHSQPLVFWMKDTYLPLEIAFLSDDGRITQISEMVPLSTKAVRSTYHCRYALEVPRGWFRENNVSVGNYISGEGITSTMKIPYRSAQAALPPTPVEDPLNPMSDHPQESAEPIDPNVTLDMSKKQLLEYANLHGLGATLVYQPKDATSVTQVKHVLPTDEGYVFESGKSGEIVKVFDDSPTITGSDWESKGKQVKSFLIDNIIAIELDKRK